MHQIHQKDGIIPILQARKYTQIPTETISKEVTLHCSMLHLPRAHPFLGMDTGRTAPATTQENPGQRCPMAQSPPPLPQDTFGSWMDLWSKSLKSRVDKNPSITRQDRYKPQDNLFSNSFGLKIWFGIGFLTTNSCRQFSHRIKTSIRLRVEFSPL